MPHPTDTGIKLLTAVLLLHGMVWCHVSHEARPTWAASHIPLSLRPALQCHSERSLTCFAFDINISIGGARIIALNHNVLPLWSPCKPFGPLAYLTPALFSAKLSLHA